MRDNLETLYGAIGDGAIAVRIPKHARKELEAFRLMLLGYFEGLSSDRGMAWRAAA